MGWFIWNCINLFCNYILFYSSNNISVTLCLDCLILLMPTLNPLTLWILILREKSIFYIRFLSHISLIWCFFFRLLFLFLLKFNLGQLRKFQGDYLFNTKHNNSDYNDHHNGNRNSNCNFPPIASLRYFFNCIISVVCW